jgi:DNA-binding transcriptional regulator YdaS (Cro superfamily)
MSNKSDTPKDQAVSEAKGASQLAKLIGVTRSAISQWKRVPAERVLQVEKATGVSRHELRPDLYPVEQAVQS